MFYPIPNGGEELGGTRMGVFQETAFGEMLRQIDAMPGETPDEKFAAYESELREHCDPSSSGAPHYDETMRLMGFVATIRRGLPKLEGASLLAPAAEERVSLAA